MEARLKLPVLSRPVRFIIAGGFNTVFGNALYLVLLFAFRGFSLSETARATTAMSIAWVFAVTEAFLVYKYFVFGGGEKVLQEFGKFSIVYVATFVFNLLTLPLLLHFTPLGPVLAQGLIVVFCAAVSFVFHSKFSFRQTGANP